MNKGGLNDIITLVLLIIIALGAVVIAWSVIRSVLINTSESINVEQFSTSYEISPSLSFFRDVSRNNNKSVRITVINKAGGANVGGYNILIYDSKGTIGSVKFKGDNAARKTYESKTHTIDFESLELIDIIKISVNPIILSDKSTFSAQRELPSNINFDAPQSRETMRQIVTDSLGDSSLCNNPVGQLDPGEQCDVSVGSKTCSDFGYTGTGGTLNCKDTCGFDLSQCINAVTPICPNNVKEQGEQCDGSVSEACQDLGLGFTGGTLSCSSNCQFDTSACTNVVVETGLIGNYYEYSSPTNPTPFTPPANPFTTTPKLTRTDPNIDFSWGSGSPHASMTSNYFAIRWDGCVIPPVGDTYTFYMFSNDGMRIYINNMNTPFVSDWNNHLATTDMPSPSIFLTGGTAYAFKVEYYEGTGSAEVKARWSRLGNGNIREVIPQSAFRTSCL